MMNRIFDRRFERNTTASLQTPENSFNAGIWHSEVLGDESEQQTIGVRLFMPINSDPAKADQIIIDPIAYSVHASKPLDVKRSSFLADQTGMVTVAVEQPGIGPNSGPLTDSQEQDLYDGNWDELGFAQWQAIGSALEEQGIDLDGKTIHYAGFSMGVSATTGLIKTAPDNVRTGNVVAWEGTAWQRRDGLERARRVGSMLLSMLHAGIGISKYRKANPKISKDFKDKIKKEIADGIRTKQKLTMGQKVTAWVLPVWAMSAGKDAYNLAEAIISRNEWDTARVHVINGEKSRISKSKANKYGVKLLHEAGIRCDYVSDPEGRHGIEDNIPFAVARYKEIFDTPLPEAA